MSLLSLHLLALLAGCAAGPSDETLVDELRVMAVVPSQPVAGLGAPTELTVHTLNPGGVEAEVMVWACTPGGAGCAESAGSQRLSAFTAEVAVGVGEATLPGSPLTWALACPVGVCAIFDEVRADPAPNTEAWRATQRRLADPLALAEELPLSGTSLALGGPAVDLAGPSGEQPVISLEGPLPESDDPELAQTLAFQVQGLGAGARAWGYTTSGGFDMPNVDIPADGQVSLDWYAADGAGAPTWLVVFRDDAGHQGVWRSDFPVEE